MTKTQRFLLKFLPKWLSYIILYLWYTGLLFSIIAFGYIEPAKFIYWGH